MNLVEELEKLKNLLDEEAITEEDYARAKSVLLEKHESSSKPNPPQKSFNIKEWSMMIHLSQFCGYFIPFAGFFVPIVLSGLIEKKRRKARLAHALSKDQNYRCTHLPSIVFSA